MIGDIFSKLFELLIRLFTTIGNFLSDAIQSVLDMLYQAFKWLGELLARLVQSLIDVLVRFFEVIYDVIRGILYFVYKVGVLIAEFFGLIWDVVLLCWSFVVGIGNTFASVFFAPSTAGSGHGYSSLIGKIMSYLDVLQLDVIAYILLFGVWIFGAFGVINILGSLRGGGE